MLTVMLGGTAHGGWNRYKFVMFYLFFVCCCRPGVLGGVLGSVVTNVLGGVLGEVFGDLVTGVLSGVLGGVLGSVLGGVLNSIRSPSLPFSSNRPALREHRERIPRAPNFYRLSSRCIVTQCWSGLGYFLI